MRLKEYLIEKKHFVEEKLIQYLENHEDIPVIDDSVKYSLMAGGKRIRPILAIMACEMYGGSIEKVMPFACSIEMIHTYSLIHDDLPAMDNDDFRRGKPTNHKVYGEAFAVLAGDALLNYAFELMLKTILKDSSRENILAAAQISKASGIEGMIGGQCIDIFYENKEIGKDALKQMHLKKTGAMLTVPLTVGAILAGATENDVKIISEYGRLIGLAFQIADDILDIEGKQEKLGKNIGSDVSNNKSTFVSLYGLEEAKKMSKNLIKEAKLLLEVYKEKADLFKELADYIVDRDS